MNDSWPEFYKALAVRLAKYSGSTLFSLTSKLAEGNDFLAYMHFANTGFWKERNNSLDPFSFMAIFNRGQSDEHRAYIGSILAGALTVDLAAPSCYHGIPYIDPRRSIYDGDSQMWNLFNAVMADPYSTEFAQAFDAAIAVHGNGLGTLTIGLYWISPDKCMAIDRVSGPWIENKFGIKEPTGKCTGAEYQAYLLDLHKAAQKAQLSYPDITYNAWSSTHNNRHCSQ